MSDTNNVVKLPTLPHLSKAIQSDLTKATLSAREFISWAVEAACKIVQARDAHKDNIGFGKWWDAQQFLYKGEPLSYQDRAALIHMGRDPARMAVAFLLSGSTSFRVAKDRFDNLVKTTSATDPIKEHWADPQPTPTASNEAVPEKRIGLDGKTRSMPVTTPTRAEAKEVIRAYKAEHGAYPSVAEAGKVTGKSRIVVEPALAAVIAEDKVALPTPTFTKAQEAQIEARLKVLDRQREATFETRVQAEYQHRAAIMFPDLEKLQAEAKLNEQYYREQLEKKAIFTDAEFNNIRNCLHPDNSASVENRQLAFSTFNLKKMHLTGKK